MDERDDLSLFAAITQRRDRVAFAELVNRHRERAFNLARRIVFDSGTAEDVVQDAMLAIWTWSKPLQTDNISGLIMSIVVSKGRTLRRSIRRRSTRETMAMELREPFSNSFKAEESELIGQLREHIDQLPELESQMLTYCFGAGMTHRQVAEMLNVSRQTVTLKINKALEMLRGSLSKAGALAAVPIVTDQNLIAAVTTGYRCPTGLTEKILNCANSEVARLPQRRSQRTKVVRSSSSSSLVALAVVSVAAVALWLGMRPAQAPQRPPPMRPAAVMVPAAPIREEVVYEDTFQGKELAGFWEKNTAPRQVFLETKVGLVLFAGGVELKVNGEAVSTDAEIVSELIALNGRPIEIRSSALVGGFVPTTPAGTKGRQMTIEFGGQRAGIDIDFPRPLQGVPMKALCDVEVLDENGSTVYRSRIDCETGTTTVRIGTTDLPLPHGGAGGRVLISPDGRVAVRSRDPNRYKEIGILPKGIQAIRLRRAVKILGGDSVAAQPLASLLVKRLIKWPNELVDK